MFNRVYKFFEEQQCIYSQQFGFRKKHSTNHALVAITETIRKALDNKKYACGIFIDLQKAFNTVNRSILVDKLNHYRVRGVGNDWFKSYLSNRSQYVSIQGFDSRVKEIRHGVPQGSVLGPLLFLIYINDLHKAIKNSSVYHQVTHLQLYKQILFMTVEGFLYSVILVPHICKLMYAYPRLEPEFHKFPKGRKPSLRLLALNNPCHPYNGVRGHRELQDSSVICVHGLHIWEIKLGFFSYILSGTISLMHIHNTLSRPSWPTFYLHLLSLPPIFTFDLSHT